jgi:S1-C subfamily serine protease
VEWSQDQPGWDDGADGDAYPPAPVPAHERPWRHPSEVGAAAWTMSEPPLALGRGLMITTGAIGCAIGAAILWLMVPSREGPVPTAGPVIGLRSTTTAVAEALAPAGTAVVDNGSSFDGDPSDTPGAPVTSAVGSPEATSAPVGPTEPGTSDPTPSSPGSAPSNTMHVTDDGAPAIVVAVAVDDSVLYLTTAHAVAGRSEVTVRNDAGGLEQAEVVSVDAHLAVIRPRATLTEGLPRTATLDTGDVVTLLTNSPTSFVVGDPTAMDGVDGDTVIEGTPVVDDDGAVVALCTKRNGAVELVPLVGGPADEPADATDAPDRTSSDTPTSTSTPTGTSGTTDPARATDARPGDTAPRRGGDGPDADRSDGPAWLGITLGGPDADEPLGVTDVDPGGPADDAGVVVGDVVLAVDGVAVRSVDELVELVSALRPGDEVRIRLRSTLLGEVAGEREVRIELGVREPVVAL